MAVTTATARNLLIATVNEEVSAGQGLNRPGYFPELRGQACYIRRRNAASVPTRDARRDHRASGEDAVDEVVCKV